MRLVSLLLLFLLPLAAHAQPLAEGTPSAVVAPADAPDPNLALLDATDTQGAARAVFEAVRRGDWTEAAAGLLVLLVVLLRKYGQKVHAAIPDDSPWDKPLWFVFDTKPGGWLLNFLTALAGGIAFAKAGGVVITLDVLRPIVHVSLEGAGLFELGSDVWGFASAWWAKRQAAKLATGEAK